MFFQERASIYDIHFKEEELRLILFKQKMYEIPSSKYDDVKLCSVYVNMIFL